MARNNSNPLNLKYDSDGVPILNASQIEVIANKLLTKHFPKVLNSPQRTPVLDILERLKETTELTSEMHDLGERGNRKILGRVKFKSKLLLLDISLGNERKAAFRFTAAHEIGHWVLHRWNYQNWKFRRNPQNEISDEMEDDERSLDRLEGRTPHDWLEWQANVFASCLVIPSKTFQTALVKSQKAIGITKNFGFVYHTPGSCSTKEYLEVVNLLAEIYGTSKTAIGVKIRTLALLKESAPSQIHSTGNALTKALNQIPLE